MSLKSYSRQRAIHVMLVYTGGCNGCDIEIVKPLIVEDYGEGICHWFLGKYISGTPTLGGEEKERNNQNNSFKVVLIPFDELDNITILGKGKELIKKCIKEKDL